LSEPRKAATTCEVHKFESLFRISRPLQPGKVPATRVISRK